MPVQNSNHKISACPDLATQLLQILTPAIFSSLLCQNRQFTTQQCLKTLPAHFLAILKVFAARTYISAASSTLADPLKTVQNRDKYSKWIVRRLLHFPACDEGLSFIYTSGE